jgi:hypothetical protein
MVVAYFVFADRPSAAPGAPVAGGQESDRNLSTAPQTVMIKPSDTAFRTHSCQPWQKAD